MSLLKRIQQIARNEATLIVKEYSNIRVQSKRDCQALAVISTISTDQTTGIPQYTITYSDGTTTTALALSQRPLATGMTVLIVDGYIV